MAKPKPKKPNEEQKRTEKTKVELKRRIPQEFHDFAECKLQKLFSSPQIMFNGPSYFSK